ncbi:SHOCT domain-containing protein [Paenibacillus sp. PL91]|uniref:SHOCT domain-containing protein n=1 Tax=Paenibacillus sp. PL91 TaxID=2729538 RepID=UPI00145E955C|nr:SHOCT domain-containing protein [Paenibacillus sp. PL91]MBC9201749.1 SHOCT domain-containing protein [Paenibacillus sp. PL91]
MKKTKAMTAGAIALTLALGGGGLWASQYVNAATASSSDKQLVQGTQAENASAKKDRAGKRGGFGHGFAQIQQQLLTYLGLEEEALQTKLKTLTLAEVAAEQGKTRAELKAKLVEWLEATEENTDKQLDSEAELTKPDSSTTAEKLLDSKGFGVGKHDGGGNRGFGKNLDAAAAALGLTEDALRTEQEAGKTLAAIAAEKGVNVQVVIDALVSDRKTKLAEELAAGEITQEQYDSAFAEAVDRATQHVNGVLPLRGEGGRGGGFGRSLDAIAEALSLTADALKVELQAGKTIAAIATEKGVAVQTLIDLQIKDHKAKLAEQLAAGTITQEQYDTRLAEAVEHATKHVNGELPVPGEGGKGSRGDRDASKEQSAAEKTADSSAETA